MKKTAKRPKLPATPNRVYREFTPEERARWQKAVAEETTDEAIQRAQRAMRGISRGGAALREAFKLLRQERERQGLSLSDMQSRTDIDRSTLCGLENADEPNPTIGTLCRVAEALGMGIEVRLVPRS